MSSPLHYAQALVDRLAAKMPDCKVGHWPSNTSRYTFAQSRHELLVTYTRSSFSEVRSALPSSLTRTLALSVTCFMRSLRDSREAYDLVDRALRALHGWQPAYLVPSEDVPGEKIWRSLGGTALRPTSDEFLSEQDGVWMWGLSFEAQRPQVATHDAAPLTPFTLTEIV